MSFCEVSYCINLDRRPDRWEEFQRDWPAEQLGPVRRLAAIDGSRCPPPHWWTAGPGAWGCCRSFICAIETALCAGAQSALFCEDDAVPTEFFAERFALFTAALPKDWGMVYLGGRMMDAVDHPPHKINDWCLAPYAVETCHAFALRGLTLAAVYQYLCRRDWQVGDHIDTRLSRWHRTWPRGVYVPAYWMFDQRGGKSDTCGRIYQRLSWTDPIHLVPGNLVNP